MSSCNRPDGQNLISTTQDRRDAQFDLGIALVLASWVSLTIAVQNSWGGPNGSERRDWFAGQISELMAVTPDADVEYLEEFLIGVMDDNFDLHVDDGSAEEVAAKIIGLRKLTLRGDFTMIQDMLKQWQERQERGSHRTPIQVARGGPESSSDESGDDNPGDAKSSGETMMEVDEKSMSLLNQPVDIPKVDEEGFTEVVGRRRRR